MSTTPPNRYVEPLVNDARVDRLWENVAKRLERPAVLWRWALLSAALAGAAAGGFFWFSARSASPAVGVVTADAELETKSDELAVTLGDGSSIKLGSQSELRVHGNRSSSIALALGRGELACDVTHVEGRKFTVVAGDVEVRVVGTKFSVKMTPGADPRVEVNVTRGVVEVESARRPGVVARIAAGQSWIENAASAGAPRGLSPPPEAPAVEPPKHEAPSVPPAPSVPSGRELFERAAERRRAGDAAAAAHAYEELLRLHPSDARASLSAFELGRLRMDRLGDLAGAIVALERAVSTNVGPSFREDALARLVSVYASQGNFSACKRARDRYLSSYPAGVHAGAVATRCGSP